MWALAYSNPSLQDKLQPNPMDCLPQGDLEPRLFTKSRGFTVCHSFWCDLPFGPERGEPRAPHILLLRSRNEGEEQAAHLCWLECSRNSAELRVKFISESLKQCDRTSSLTNTSVQAL
ncbi:Bestrophin-4 [Manis pentadactyla]|nr:Bestrophin-4 [Manis pentadactyla]